MNTATERYAKNKADAREKVIAFLYDISKIENEARTTRLAAVRSMLNLSGHRGFAEVVLGELEKEGHIELGGRLIYLIGPWDEKAGQTENAG